MKHILLFVTLIILSMGSAVAGNLYTMDLVNQQGDSVEGDAYIYVCTDISCTEIDTSFSRQEVSSTNGRITFEGLGLQELKHFGIFLYSEGYLGYKIPLYNDDNSGKTAQATIPFSQANQCYAPIVQHRVANEVKQYEPLQINVTAEIAAEVASAFRISQEPPSFRPPEATAQEIDFWSVQTTVTVQITDAAGVVHTIEDSANIFADQTKDFSFTWIPEVSGETIVEIIATVEDNQCKETVPISTIDYVTVVENLDDAFYYSVLKDATVPEYPVANEEFDITFETLSNYNNNGNMIAVPTKIIYEAIGQNNQVVASRTQTYDPIDEITFRSITFPASFPAGTYDIKLTAIADDDTYDVPKNTATTIVELIVEEPRYALDVLVLDEKTNEGIFDARVDFQEIISYTNSIGKARFAYVLAGEKQLTITKDGFIPEQDVISLFSDKMRTYTLERTTCNDGIDNDGDTFIDYPQDPDCTSINDHENRDDTPEPERYDVTINVIDELRDQPLENAEVTFNGDSFTTGPLGIISITNVDEGVYVASADKDGWKEESGISISVSDDTTYTFTLDRQTCNDEIDNDADTFIDYPQDPDCTSINDHENRDDTIIDPTYDFTLTVKDSETSLIIPGVYVTFEGEEFITNNNGQIFVRNLTQGIYTYSTSRFGYQDSSGTFTIDSDDAATIYLNPIEIIEEYDVTLTIRDNDTQQAIPGATVLFNDATFTANANGIIFIYDLLEGEYSYTASANGYESKSGSYQITETIIDTIYLTPIEQQVDRYNFTLTVKDAISEIEISAATIIFGGVTFVTDTNGKISIGNLIAGTYEYTASANGYESRSGSYQITNNTNEVLLLLPVVQNQFDLFATPIIGTYNESSDVIICQDNFAVGYDDPVIVPVSVFLNTIEQTNIASLRFGNPIRECINFGRLTNGTYSVIQNIDPLREFFDDNRSNNIIQYTFFVGKTIIEPVIQEKEKTIVREIGITKFDFDAIDYRKATELDKIQLGFKNDGNKKLENVIVTISIPELAVWDRAGPYNLYVGETEYEYMDLAVYENYEPGWYDLRVSIMTNSGYSRARWYEVWLE